MYKKEERKEKKNAIGKKNGKCLNEKLNDLSVTHTLVLEVLS